MGYTHFDGVDAALLKIAGTQVTATAAELNAAADIATAGVVEASKGVVVSSNKDIGDFRNLDCVNLDAGASGAAGTVDVFPATASKGKLAITCTNQTGDTTVTLNANAMGQATTVNIPDPGAAASYVAQSTAALTLGEVDVLQDATAGTAVASKAVVLDANKYNDGVVCTIRANHLAAAITAGTATAVPAVTGKSFVLMAAWMRANGGNVSGPTTVEIVIETTATVMLSHVTADLTSGVWRGGGTGDGTNVITGITAGGLVTAGKKLLVTDTGGTGFATATSLDTICVGYWTTA